MLAQFPPRRSFLAALLTSLTLLLGLLWIAPLAHATDFAPGCTGGMGDAAALQANVVTAYSNSQPDTITLAAGCTYTLTATLSIYSDGNLITFNGNGAIINANGVGRVLFLESGSNVILNDLTITGGSINNSGAGIFAFGSTLTLNRVTVTNNSAWFGGGIYSAYGTTLTINDSFITGNSADTGGGIDTSIVGTVTLNRSTVSGNSASYSGGGIHNYAQLIVQDSVISANTAQNSGGGIEMLLFQSAPKLFVQGSIIRDNRAGSGGAISGYAASLSLTGSCITGNSDVAVNVNGATANGNWWGTANGPGSIATGSGDTLSAGVDYSGFLTSPPPGCATLSVPTTTHVVSDVNPSSPGQTVIFTATVSDGKGGAPSGTVTFALDSAAQTPVSLTGGVATFSTRSLTPGNHLIAANYTGDTGLVASSGSMTQSVLTPGVTISPASGLTTTEAGGTASFEVVLGTLPTSDVTINFVSSNTGEGIVSPTSLTFTPSNWNTPQSATLTGVDDAAVDGDAAYSVDTSIISADSFYSAIDPADVNASNTDDDTSGVNASPLQFRVTEGDVRSYQLALTTMPSSAPVIIRLSFDSGQLSVDDSSTPVDLSFTDQTPQIVTFKVVTNPEDNNDRDVTIRQQVVSSSASEYSVGMNAPTITIHIGDVPPPPPTPLCEDHNFDKGGVVRSGTSDALGYAINCRVLYQNGTPTQWLGSNLYNSGSIGIEGVLNLGVEQAIDIFSPAGMTYFQGGAVFCLRGEGSLIWMAASGMPRHAEIIGSYTVTDFPGFTCATLFEPGTFVLVSQNPLTR